MRDSLRKLLLLLDRRERRSFAMLVVIMAAEAMLEMASIGIVPLYITAIAYPDALVSHPWVTTHLSVAGQAWLTHGHLLAWGGFALLLFFVGKTAYTITAAYFKSRFAQNRAQKLSLRLFAAYLDAPYVYHLQHNTSELLRNINQDCIQLATRVLVPMVEFLSCTLIVVGITAVLMTFMQLGVLAWLAGFLAFGIGSATLLQNRVKHLGQESQNQRAAVIQTVTEGLGGVKEIKLLQRGPQFVRRLASGLTRIFRSQRTVNLIQLAIPSMIESIGVIGLVGVTLMLFAGGSNTHEIVATLSVFAVALTRLKGAVRGMMDYYTEVRHNASSLEVVYAGLRDLAVLNQPDDSPVTALPLRERIELRALTYTYPGAAEPSLRGIDLVIQSGEAIGFVGTTGAGKSTLLDVLLGILQPTAGSILVDGRDIQLARSAWQRHLGYVPQAFFLIDGSITDNITLGLAADEVDGERVAEAAAAAALTPLLAQLPHGLDTRVGERGNRLSGGERQRIAIARALYHRPDVLIMDEATSALDNTTEGAIIEAVAALKGDRTVLLVAHRLSTVRRCDRIVFLKNGRIDAVGSFDELQRNHPEFRVMAGA